MDHETGRLGEHVITSKTKVNATPCGLTPTQFPQDAPLRVNSLKCEPKFLSEHGHIPHVSPGTINLYLPTSMSGAYTALNNAKNLWNSALAGTGVVLNVVNDGSTCDGGAECITVTTASQTPCGIADWTSVNPSTGAITGV